jgi:hypothetical protein
MRLMPLAVASSLFALACTGGLTKDATSDVETVAGDGDGDGFTADDGDCDDEDEDINPDASERCDDMDNDCDGSVDEGNACGGGGDTGGGGGGGNTDSGNGGGGSADTTDDDRDGFSEADGDCNDRSTAVYPGARESCNGRDDNCDGSIDEGGVCGSDTGGGGGGGGGGGATGLAAAYWVGTLNATSSRFSSGTFGVAYYGLASGASVCDFRGTLTSEGSASTCSGCSWAFNLSPLSGSRATSGDCAPMGLSSGAFDGAFDYSWGFAPSYVYSGSYGSYFLEDAVLLNDGTGWFPFAFNYGAYGIYQVSASSSRVDIQRQATDSYGTPVYGYYYL